MLLLPTFVNHGLWWHSTKLHNQFDLLLLVIAWEERLASVELSKDAPHGPYVYLFGVFDSENYLRRSIEARLHISINLFVTEAA